MKTNSWVTIKDQSLAVYTRQAGFDLAIFKEYSDSVQKELRRRAIKEALFGIRDSFEEAAGRELASIDRGVYVISLSHPLCIQYRSGWSPVIYIGIGSVDTRIKNHFEGSLFDFMLSLSGANFDFSFAIPAKKNSSNYYKHVEHEMLEYFSEHMGGIDERKRFPILNNIAGANQGVLEPGDWWARPLKVTGRRPLWALSPTQHSDFAPLD